MWHHLPKFATEDQVTIRLSLQLQICLTGWRRIVVNQNPASINAQLDLLSMRRLFIPIPKVVLSEINLAQALVCICRADAMPPGRT
jgi:hypothetical protein